MSFDQKGDNSSVRLQVGDRSLLSFLITIENHKPSKSLGLRIPPSKVKRLQGSEPRFGNKLGNESGGSSKRKPVR